MKKYIALLTLIAFPVVTLAGGIGGVVPENAKKATNIETKKETSPAQTEMEKEEKSEEKTSSMPMRRTIARRSDVIVSQTPVNRGINQQSSFDIVKEKDMNAAKKLARFRSIMRRSQR